MNIKKLLSEFMTLVATEEVEVYNEFSLQHELGIFLRAKLTGYKVQFERNTKFFGIEGTVKHEIDIAAFSDKEKYAIEVKYPQNGQYPEQMFAFIKDIKFMEELKQEGFNRAYCLTLVRDKNFYSGKKQDGIYTYFRGEKPICGSIIKPTGKRDEAINICGSHNITWKQCGDKMYFLIAI